ncbi:MAG: type II toxin-antitoxin system VapC family toxin [Fimbriimonadales bacterium]|nr:type II toxin-antitoxin system VapC family toxin [Fimbriimonadales bacterium]
MTRYLLDTNHVSAFWSQDAQLRARLSQTTDAEYYLCAPSVGELWFMVFNSARVEYNQARLEVLLQQFPVLDFDAAAAEFYGKLWTELRKRGRPIPVIDAQIASIALSRDLVLLTADVRHFAEVDGLTFENWLAP